MKVGIAIARASSVDNTWTTIHLAEAALRRGWTVRFIEPWDFEIDERGHLLARAHAFDHPISADAMVGQLVERTALRRFVDLISLDLLLLRAAPLDTSLLTFALLARDRGVPTVNDPAGLLQVSHKGWLASLPDVASPETLVTRSRAASHLFYEQQRTGVIVKPARGSGGRSVSKVLPHEPADLDLAFDIARRTGDGFVVIQNYLLEADAGEKRLVWLDGKVLGGYVRLRANGEFRHNLKRGGHAGATTVTPEEVAVVQRLSPHLTRLGIRLAGIDVIGNKIIEVNTLNPGGTFHTDRLNGTQLVETILDKLTEQDRTPSESMS